MTISDRNDYFGRNKITHKGVPQHRNLRTTHPAFSAKRYILRNREGPEKELQFSLKTLTTYNNFQATRKVMERDAMVAVLT